MHAALTLILVLQRVEVFVLEAAAHLGKREDPNRSSSFRMENISFMSIATGYHSLAIGTDNDVPLSSERTAAKRSCGRDVL